MATAGYKAQVRIAGAALATINEAFSAVVSTTVWHATAATKRVIDWSTAITVQTSPDGIVWTTVTNYTVDYLFGRITFSAPLGVGVQVRASYNYLPLYTFAEGRDVTFDVAFAELDTTIFGDTDVHRIQGLEDMSGSITSLSLLNVELDGTGGAEKKLIELLNDRDYVVLCYKPDSAGTFEMRAVVQFSSEALSQAVDGLAEATLTFVGAAPKSTTGVQVGLTYA